MFYAHKLMSKSADFVTVLFNSVFTIFWDFNIQCRVCYTACSVNRRGTVSLFKFPIYIYIIRYPYSHLVQPPGHLNYILLKGTDVINPIRAVLLRFRKGVFATFGDIKKDV